MLSPNFDIKDLLEKLKSEDYLCVIYLANQEATEAERLILRRKENNPVGSREYVKNLKELIHFMRYGYKPYGIKTEYYKMFVAARERTYRQSI